MTDIEMVLVRRSGMETETGFFANQQIMALGDQKNAHTEDIAQLMRDMKNITRLSTGWPCHYSY